MDFTIQAVRTFDVVIVAYVRGFVIDRRLIISFVPFFVSGILGFLSFRRFGGPAGRGEGRGVSNKQRKKDFHGTSITKRDGFGRWTVQARSRVLGGVKYILGGQDFCLYSMFCKT